MTWNFQVFQTSGHPGVTCFTMEGTTSDTAVYTNFHYRCISDIDIGTHTLTVVQPNSLHVSILIKLYPVQTTNRVPAMSPNTLHHHIVLFQCILSINLGSQKPHYTYLQHKFPMHHAPNAYYKQEYCHCYKKLACHLLGLWWGQMDISQEGDDRLIVL